MGEPRKTLTVRLDPEVHSQLKLCSDKLDESMNRLATLAIDAYVQQLGGAIEHDLQRTLARIRAYRHRDPRFEAAIDALVRAETQEHDPAEGSVIPKPARDIGEARRELEALLD